MGASQWFYSVPFRPDVQAALDELRQKVYDEGDYYKVEPNPDFLIPLDEFLAKYDDGSGDGVFEFMLEERERVQQLRPPTDPDSLFEWQGGEGTHSIIDMANGVSDEPLIFAVAPLSDEELVDTFGTAHPSAEQVRGTLESGWTGGRDRWYGTYLFSYRADGIPDEIHFTGYSGD